MRLLRALLAVLLITGSLPALAAGTATKVEGIGQPGTPAGGILTVQGSPSGTPIPVTPSAPSGTQDVNLVQTGGVTQLRGAGTVGTGSERVAVGQDTTTIAGSAPGTAGTASANVLTVQGVASMTPVQTTQAPSSSSAVAIAHGQSTATESGHAAICGAACNLYSLTATNLSTTTVLMLMIFNSTTVPGDGAVTPDQCLPVSPGPGATGVSSAGGPPTRYGTGISVALSSGASCTTKTASVNGFFTWAVQ